MKHSVNRVLTARTRNLPRLAEFVCMYARRTSGEAADDAVLPERFLYSDSLRLRVPAAKDA